MSTSLELGLQANTVTSSFLCECWGLNSVPHAHAAGTLPTRPSWQHGEGDVKEARLCSVSHTLVPGLTKLSLKPVVYLANAEFTLLTRFLKPLWRGSQEARARTWLKELDPIRDHCHGGRKSSAQNWASLQIQTRHVRVCSPTAEWQLVDGKLLRGNIRVKGKRWF